MPFDTTKDEVIRLSMKIKALSNQIDRVLFSRAAKKQTLTEADHNLIDECVERIFDLCEQLAQQPATSHAALRAKAEIAERRVLKDEHGAAINREEAVALSLARDILGMNTESASLSMAHDLLGVKKKRPVLD